MHSLSIGPVGLAIDYVLVWGALFLALIWLRLVVKEKPLRAQVENTLFSVFVTALLGARAGFIWRMWPQYQFDLLAMLDIRDGGFLPQAGLIAGALVLIWRVHKLPVTRNASVKVVLLTTACMLPVYIGINWVNRSATMPLPVVQNNALQTVDFAVFTDKPIVLNVWATWCPPCRREMPVLEHAQQNYPNLHFIFLNQGESAAEVNDFLNSQGLKLENVLLDTSGAVSEAFGVAVLPTTLFYSPQGKLLYRHVGGVSTASLDYALQQLTQSTPEE